jgi:phosphoglycolate phosphatase
MHHLLNAKTIIFDLDGTLVDTAPDLCASLNHCLSLKGLSPLPVAKVRHLVGYGAKALLKKGLEIHKQTNIEDTIEELFPSLLSHYGDHIADKSTIFEGVFTLLDHCLSQGKNLGICTNKPGFLARPLVEALNLAPYFEVILGADDVENKKPNGDHILDTIRAVGGNADDAIMVGDSPVDYRAAKNANVPIILLNHGYSDVPLNTLNPDLLTDSFSTLMA